METMTTGNSYTYTTTTTPYYPYYNNPCCTTTIDTPNFITKDEAMKIVNEILNKNNKETEKKTMQFGPITDDSARYSAKGIAIKNAENQYVIYNQEKHSIEDVTPFALKGQYLYTLPIAHKDIMINDTILHQKHYCCVIDGDETLLQVIDLHTNEERIIYPTQSPFGFNYITKVVSLIDQSNPSEDAPFGNYPLLAMCSSSDFNPLMLLALSKDKKLDPKTLLLLAANDKNNIKDLLPFLLGLA